MPSCGRRKSATWQKVNTNIALSTLPRYDDNLYILCSQARRATEDDALCGLLRARPSPDHGPLQRLGTVQVVTLRSASDCEKEATAEREARDTRTGLAP